MKVDVFPSDKITPQQALLYAEEELGDMASVAIVWLTKDGIHPRLTVSTMKPVDLNFMGVALQQHSLRYLKD